MPHLVLEYSSNLLEEIQFTGLFSELHNLLVNHLPTQRENCKSRAYEVNDYCLGDGSPRNAFVALTIRIMPGRSSELLKAVAAEAFAILQDYFTASLKALELQFSVEIKELSEVYLKA